MKLTVSNANITNTFSTARMTLGNASIVESLTLGNVSVTPSQISVGSVSITPTAVSVPSLILGGSQFSGGLQGGIINYQEFTANGTWNNPLFYTQVSLSQGLTYSFYTQGTSTNPTTEAGLDALFNTATSSPTVTFGGTGIHSGTINWGDATSTSGAGGTPGTKPAYLPADQFSWMVEGYILAPETGTYFFGVDGDDAVDVFVNGVNVASYYGAHGFNGAWTGGATGGTQVSGSISLTAGQYYTFRARQQDGGGGDGIQVGWRKPSDGAIALIPASAFYYGTVTYSSNTSLTGYEQVLVMAWGGGGGGNTSGGGGGGGACLIGHVPLQSLANTCSVTVGSGGAAVTDGSNSTFVINSSSSLIAYGGGAAASGGGGGGGTFGVGTNAGVGGGPLGGAAGTTAGVSGGVSTFGGAGAGGQGATITGPGGVSVFGGGGGGRSNATVTSLGGNSVFGGAGGIARGAAAISIFGGNGGNSTVSPTTPGGGGYSTGARGEVRVWVFGPASITVGPPTYSLTANTATLFEGSSVLYTVSTTNVSNGTTLYYTLNNSSTAVATDFTTAVNGSVIINGGTGTFTLTAADDADSVNETFQIDVRNTSTTGSIVASNGSVSVVPAVQVQYLVIAGGGGGGGGHQGGGGGAGGYQESNVAISLLTSYTVTVGAGGAGGVEGGAGALNGSNSVFGSVTSIGGGNGGGDKAAGTGGSGGGGQGYNLYPTAAVGTAGQGYAGGDGAPNPTFGQAGGGGGAGQAGTAGLLAGSSGKGGDGLSSTITGSAVTRGGGGGGGGGVAFNVAYTGGAGGAGGGGAGDDGASSGNPDGIAGTVNTGGGGGGSGARPEPGRDGGAGGSGVVILRYPSARTITVSAGLTSSTATVGSDKVTTITAGTGTVSWS